MEDKSLLQYTDAEDKCFGVVGMALGMFIFNAERYLSNISIDRSDLDCVEFTPDFHIVVSQEVSAKTIWNQRVKRFQVTTGMLLSNVICRWYIHRHRGVDAAIRNLMLAYLNDEGTESCQLEKDEIEMIFNKNTDYLSRAFQSPDIAMVARRMAADLARRHTLAHEEILAYLNG